MNELLPQFNICDRKGFSNSMPNSAAVQSIIGTLCPQMFQEDYALASAILRRFIVPGVPLQYQNGVLPAPTCWCVCMVYVGMQYLIYEVGVCQEEVQSLTIDVSNMCNLLMSILEENLLQQLNTGEDGQIDARKSAILKEAVLRGANVHPLQYVWQSIKPPMNVEHILQMPTVVPPDYDFTCTTHKINVGDFIAALLALLQECTASQECDGNPSTVREFLLHFMAVLMLGTQVTVDSKYQSLLEMVTSAISSFQLITPQPQQYQRPPKRKTSHDISAKRNKR